MLREHKLSFRCKTNLQYMVNVEEHKYDVYAIKFYLKSHALSENKYKLLTWNFDASRVLATCIEIMLYFYNRNKKASFVFIGSNSIGESISDTKFDFTIFEIIELFKSRIKQNVCILL